MKRIELKTVENAGNTDPLNRRYYIDGRKTTHQKYDACRATALKHDCFHTVSVNGVTTNYSQITI